MSDSRAAPAAVALGVLAAAGIPLAVAAAWLSNGVALVGALEVAVPVSLALGLVAVAAARRASFRIERSVRRESESLVRTARLLAWGAVSLAVSGAIALG